MSTPHTEAGYPWHFKVLVGAAVVYLGIRLVQGVALFIRWVS